MTTPDLEPRRTALILIDLMPRIIALETGPFSGDEVLERCVALADATRAAGGLVVNVRVERPNVDVQPEGSGLAIGLQEGDVEIVKRTVGAFHQTGLDDVLRSHNIDTVVLAGIATNFGVESTGRVADEHGYRTIYVTDAMTGLDAHAHEFAVSYIFPRFGETSTSAEYLGRMGVQVAQTVPDGEGDLGE
jgi:nicotinamidase-related amidase